MHCLIWACFIEFGFEQDGGDKDGQGEKKSRGRREKRKEEKENSTHHRVEGKRTTRSDRRTLLGLSSTRVLLRSLSRFLFECVSSEIE